MKVAVFVLWIEFFTVTVTLSRRPSTLVTTVPLNSGLYIFLQLLHLEEGCDYVAAHPAMSATIAARSRRDVL